MLRSYAAIIREMPGRPAGHFRATGNKTHSAGNQSDPEPASQAYLFMERESSDDLQKMADKASAELRKDPMHPDKAAEAIGLTATHADNIQAGDPLPDVGNAKEVTEAIAPLHKGEKIGRAHV